MNGPVLKTGRGVSLSWVRILPPPPFCFAKQFSRLASQEWACEISKKHMYIVYILRSIKKPEKIYVGYTEDLSKRLKEHNDKKSNYSNRYAPWKLETRITYRNRNKAKQFEKYLKSGSGFAFLKRRLI